MAKIEYTLDWSKNPSREDVLLKQREILLFTLEKVKRFNGLPLAAEKIINETVLKARDLEHEWKKRSGMSVTASAAVTEPAKELQKTPLGVGSVARLKTDPTCFVEIIAERPFAGTKLFTARIAKHKKPGNVGQTINNLAEQHLEQIDGSQIKP